MEKLITKSFKRLLDKGVHRGFITYEELGKSLGKRHYSQENIEKAEIIKAISNNHPGERNASVASVSPISHISVDSLMSNDDHYSYQVSTNKENFINRQIFDDIYKTPYIDKKSLECAY